MATPPGRWGSLAEKLGKVRPYRKRWRIDFGRATDPRFLYTARGVRFDTEETAQAVLSAIRVKVSRGATPQDAFDEFCPVSSARNRVGLWLDRYLSEEEVRTAEGDLSPNHMRELRRHARNGGAFRWWDDVVLSEIDAASLNEWRLTLSEQGLSAKSIKNIVGYFRAFVSWLHRLERIDRIPAFPRVKVRDHSPVILGRNTQDLVLAEIPWERRGAFLAARHGVRPGEVRALDIGDAQRRDDVMGLLISKALKGPNANAPTGSTKTGESHWIPIEHDLIEWIAWRMEARTKALSAGAQESPWVSIALFPNPSARNKERRWITNALREDWKRAAKKVGVEAGLYEGTKHSAATGWRSSGMSLEMIQRMLRHRDSRSTERYAKLADGALVEAFSRTRRRKS